LQELMTLGVDLQQDIWTASGMNTAKQLFTSGD
jgi:hypothetical protein